MNAAEKSLLEELEATLDDKMLQKAVVAAYIKKPDAESIIAAVLSILQKATVRK